MIYKVDPNNPEIEIIKKATNLIKSGHLVICPTDTAYMLSANALDKKAVRKIFAFKRRSLSNPIHVVVTSIKEAESYVFINENAKKIARRFLPGPLTLILPKRKIVPDILTANLQTLGIRIPENKICVKLAAQCGLPLSATSVNINKEKATYSVEEMKAQFGKQLDEIPLILDAGKLLNIPVSTIVDLTGKKPRILREGPISGKDIMDLIVEGRS